jgi:tetratricopeptide (TPR) repeat protein
VAVLMAEGMRVAMADGPGGDAGWRVFVSHTSELRDFPRGRSYVDVVERAVSACGHVVVDMADFPAADLPAAELCAERVRGCQVYVGVLGTRYGSPVRDEPKVSYTELEFGTATAAGLPRLVFLLDTDADDVGIPPSRLIDHEFGARQEAFRRRVRDAGLVTQTFTDPGTLGQLVERSLRELAEQLRRVGERPGGQVPAVLVAGEIPQEPLGFQPRAELLAALDEPGPGPQVRVVRALTGLRGVGKTHLAAAYARAKLAAGWRLVAWVNAEDEGGVLAGLAEVAAGLGLAAGAGDARAAGRAVRHWLEADGERCLLVFDNAVDAELLRPFIPAGGRCRVIITSNYQPVASLGAGVPVDVFTEAEALTFLAARTGQADAAGAQELAAELGCLPLALAQAAAVITAQHLSYDTYLDRLRRLPVAGLLAAEEAGQYPRGVAAAVLVSLDSVRAGDLGAACGAVMDLLAVLAAAGVRRSLIHAAARDGLPGREGPVPALAAEVADRVLGRLAGASLLTFSLDGSAVAAHRLVMRVIRENLAAGGVLTEVCAAAARLFDGQVDSLNQRWHEDRAASRDLVEQIIALDETAARCPPGSDLDGRMIRLRGWALWFLDQLGDSAAQAIVIGEQLLADQEQALGPDHPDTLTSRGNLALAYHDAGRLEKAIGLDEQNLAARERDLGPDHPDTLTSRNNLAVAYWAAGRTEEAIRLHEQALAARERVLGPDHPDTLQSRNNLGLAYQAAGRTEEAIRLNEQNLAAREHDLGPDHPNTLQSRNDLGLAYQAAGRTEEAIRLHEQNLAARERVLGPDHPNTLQSRNNLANAYRDAGRTDES